MSKGYCKGTFKILKTPLEKAIGAMFWKKGIFVFILNKESKFSATIHTFFCNPLHVYWLDSKLRLIDYKFCKPNRVYAPRKAAAFIIESTEKLHKDKLRNIIRKLREFSAS